MLFCGDTFMMSRDGGNPFAHVLDTFQDVTVCLNFETSLQSDEQKIKNVCLSVAENDLDAIPETAGIISLVNNHIWDSGSPQRLVEELKRRGKAVIGPANPSMTCTTLDGMSVNFYSAYFSLPRLRVSFNGSLADALERMLLESKAERNIVNLHWGYEHTDVPAPFQRDLARRLVDAGACLIIGHHPHVPQGWEVYRDATIFYSLGNFNFWHFDNEPSDDNKWGYMVRYDLRNGRAEHVPYRINDNYQPVAAAGLDKEELSGRLESLCRAVHSTSTATWFSAHYGKWRARELKVWKRLCRETKNPLLALKFLVWLLLPMQFRYCIHIIIMRFLQLFSKKVHNG